VKASIGEASDWFFVEVSGEDLPHKLDVHIGFDNILRLKN
jgi:hypothetical protein